MRTLPTPLKLWTAPKSAAELARLVAPGVLGFYSHFEVTEVFAYLKGQQNPLNIFTLLVAEDRANAVVSEPTFLGNRITLKSLKDWTFGIQRYLRPVEEIAAMFDSFDGAGVWQCSGKQLNTGVLSPIPPQFVQPDSFQPIPWNSVLKNNFWNGAYVFEWSDSKKLALQPFFDEPTRLQELSEHIGKQVPICIASLSDRLGNIAVQLPSTLVMANFGRLNATDEFYVDLAWHPKATPRILRASCALEFDGAVSGYAACEVTAPYTLLPIKSAEGDHHALLWDDEHQIILMASGPNAFIRTIGFNMHAGTPEPRTFKVPGDPVPRRIGVSHTVKSEVGQPDNLDAKWTRQRMYSCRDEKRRRMIGVNHQTRMLLS